MVAVGLTIAAAGFAGLSMVWGWKSRLVMDSFAYSIDFGFRPLCFTSHEACGASSKTSFSKPTKICKT